MEKLNIAELLKNCPTGMELDCMMFEDMHFDHISDCGKFIFCYINYEDRKTSISFNKYGAYCNLDKSKCVLFPKGKTTWEGFHRPFVEGDIVSTETGMYIGIVKSTEDSHECCTFCSIHGKQDFHVGKKLFFGRLATKEEKQIMFDIIKANGYHWNSETKKLEKLPRFKVGDRIKHKGSGLYCTLGEYAEGISAYRTNIGLSIIPTDLEHWELVPDKPYFKVGDKIRRKNNTTIIKTIGNIYSDGYALYDGYLLPFKEQDEWELVPNKFDINTLKPFDQVLVRDFDNETWEINFFSSLRDSKHFKCLDLSYVQCIPYKGNEYLRGTTANCSNYYKTWKE